METESSLQQRLFSLEVIVLRAHDLPRPLFLFGKKRRFYVTLTDGSIIKRTAAIQSEDRAVEWNEKLDAFDLHPTSRIRLSLYSERSKHDDQLIGTLDMPLESQNDNSFLLISVGSAPRVRLYLSINLSKNATSTTHALNPTTAKERATATLDVAPRPTSLILTSDTQAGVSNGDVEKVIRSAEIAIKAMNCYDTWGKAVERVQWVMETISSIAELHPYAKIAYSLLTVIPKTFLKQIDLDTNIKDLLSAIHDGFDFAQDAVPLQNVMPASRQANVLVLMLGHVGNCCDFIMSYADKNFRTRLMKNATTQVDKQISDLCRTFVELRRKFLDHTSLAVGISVFQILDDMGVLSAEVTGITTQLNKMTTQLSIQISDLDLDNKIAEIPYRGPLRSGTERSYLPGTRTRFFDYIADWVTNPESKRGLVLFGQAGTGKSSIADEIARRFRVMNRLTSFFTFLRAEQTKREDYHLFTTIVHDLSRRYPSFKKALGKVIRDDKSLRTAQQYSPLFESMLLQPLEDVHIVGPVLIIIDGLDESGDVTGPKGLHAFLAEHIAQLPANFRILITSRLEADIVDHINQFQTEFDIVRMDNPVLSASTDDDIRHFFQNRLPPNIFKKHGGELAKKAEGLFQWAAVACGFITSPPGGLTRTDCVRALLAGSGEHGVDLSPLNELYKGVLEGYCNAGIVRRRFQSVIGHVLAAFEPLSIQTLATLSRYSAHGDDDDHDDEDDEDDDDAVLAIVGRLGSLLSNVTSTDHTLPIVPLHTSFRDFLINQSSGHFYIDLGEAHRQLVHSCLGLMLRNLKFNICELPSSYYTNDKIDGSLIEKHISSALFYACCFWDDHLERVKISGDLLVPLRSLFNDKFLFWLEVLSVKDSVGLAIPALWSLNVWLTSGQGIKSLRDELKSLQEFIVDAGSFVRYFAMAITKSAPHIYVSALPFAPTSSLIARQYSSRFPNTLTLIRGELAQWPAGMELNIPTGSACSSVAFSPDGMRIVSGLFDYTIRVWNSITGHMEGDPFTGHTGSVNCVALSPDGMRIVSGSRDGTIRLWNTSTGQKEGDPLIGHTSWVNSVAFAPDGTRIVSGSRDRTIRVWNATTGQIEGSPLTGHTGSVNSVAFSPDGTRFVSGSGDGTIRVWNATTGDMEGDPFIGHTRSVISVAFSPDATRIVSGSHDRTIRVWNVTTGQIEGSPFAGHMDLVNSVVFSPDGTRIVSGSLDHTIRVWNVSTGQIEGDPFTGHKSSVTSVTFSPDGTRIVSGSNDGTIRVWNATTGQMEEDPSTVHTDSVKSVAFSPGGTRIVSGSRDHTIRVWNATTGQMEGRPFTGHTDSVKSVAFSPDGTRIVSGSLDHTIRVWNATTGQIEGSPLTGHTRSINSVAFSPDGVRIVSGSTDRAIRVWNATTGHMEGGPFTGHTSWVTSVAFSPDGTKFVSGSTDRAIRVWNATADQMEGDPFIGHMGSVKSVAFSPNGTRIVSGSNDGTIRVWNATTDQMEEISFTGHAYSVNSVAFSPDGTRIVSGSDDGTIRVWNATTGDMEGSPFTGHRRSVKSVAFSPDGTRIVSGSDDRTIRLWNVSTGQMEGGPFTRRTDLLKSAGGIALHQIPFTDSSTIDNDGWNHAGLHGGLFLWIPLVHRLCLHRPSNVWIAGDHETRIDFSNFVYGQQWAACQG